VEVVRLRVEEGGYQEVSQFEENLIKRSIRYLAFWMDN